ncbi:MAG: HAD family hydrolase [Nitrososphaeria archaeon]|nr:HAD family hydrolase [Nitrososphaeria archaeon]
MSQKILVVSFDVWDTILDLKPFHAKIAEKMASYTSRDYQRIYLELEENYRILKDYRRRRLLRFDDLINHCLELSSKNLGINGEVIKKCVTKAVLEVDSRLLVIDDAKNIFSELIRSGRRLVTVGNLIFWPGSYNRILLERAGLTEYFSLQIYADEAKVSKPDKDIFLKVCNELNVLPENVLHVGDNRIEDFEGALSAGMNAVWINPWMNSHVSEEGKGIAIKSIKYLIEALNMIESRAC